MSNLAMLGIQQLVQHRFVRFLMVGGIATGSQFLLLVAFVEWLLWDKVFASASAYALAAVVNYLLNYYFTFGSKQRHIEAFSKFAVVVAIGLGVNTLCFWLFLAVTPYYLAAQIGATLITLTVNFLLHKHWIYRINP